MYRMIDYRWEGIYTLVVFSASLLAFGIKAMYLPGDGAAALAFILLLPGTLFLGGYFLALKLIKSTSTEMPRYRDQFIVVVIVVASVSLSHYGEWVLAFGMLTVFVFATQRLWSKPESFWRLWFFRAARIYFREIKKYTNRPNKRIQTGRPTAGR